MTLPRLLALYLALASALLAWRYAGALPEKAAERWTDPDERAVLDIAETWKPGSGAAGLWDVALRGIESQKQIRPLHWVAWALLSRAWGEDRRPFYALGFALHLLSGWLVLLLIREFAGRDAWLGPLLGALFFEAHDLQRLPLLWLAAQQDLLAAPFYLGALVCLARWLSPCETAPNAAGRARRLAPTRFYGLSVLLVFLGIASKEFIATLGPVAVLWIALSAGSMRDFGRRLPWAVPFLAATALTLALRAALPHGYALASPEAADQAEATLRELYDPAWGNKDLGRLLRTWLLEAPWRILSGDGAPLVFAGVVGFAAYGMRRARSARVPAMALGAALLYFLPVLPSLARPPTGNQAHWFYAPVLLGAVWLGWGVSAGTPSAERHPNA